jgi:hypothetical protein
VRLKLAHMVADHLRVNGSANYAELRDHPEFSPWFGRHLGHRGEKRFDRLVKSVKRSQPRKTARRSTNGPGPVPGPSQLSQEISMSSPAHQLAHAGAPSFEELLAGLARRCRELEVAISACYNEFGELVVPTLSYKRLTSEHRATTLAIGQLSKQHHDALTSGPVLEAIVDRLLAAQDPDAARQIAADVNELVRRSTGLSPTGSAS